jgi:hypothetical protein
MAFRETRRGVPPAESLEELADALNIAASALSRLVTIYSFDGAGHAPIVLDLTQGRFVDGATAFRLNDARSSTLTSLLVKRSDLGSALLHIRRAGLPFTP